VVRRYLSGREQGYPFSLRLVNGVQLELRDFHDLVTAWVIFFRNEYHVPEGATAVLDIGANIGCFSLLAAGACPTAQVIAVEPFPRSFSRLTGNIEANGFASRVSCWPVGIAAESGQRLMADSGPSQCLGMLPRGAGTGQGIAISVVSLEQLLSDACRQLQREDLDFVKIDVEGGEHESILAASPACLQRMRRLGMEYHPTHPKGRLFEHLASAGFLLEHDRVLGPDVGVAHFRRR
jgi:FkbM family methyltransferase